MKTKLIVELVPGNETQRHPVFLTELVTQEETASKPLSGDGERNLGDLQPQSSKLWKGDFIYLLFSLSSRE